MFTKVSCAVALLLATSAISQAQTPDIVPLGLASECTTDGTSWDGKGRTCYADNAACLTAPSNYVIAKDRTTPSYTSANGALKDNPGAGCIITFSDPVEVIAGTGITQPTKVCFQATAQSNSGMDNAGARGWSKCVLNGIMTKYK